VHTMSARRILLPALAAACTVYQSPSLALGFFGRACPVADIPSVLKLPAMSFFEAIGDAPSRSLTNITTLSTAEQYKYWIHEAITADYANVRFYLYAELDLYVWDSTMWCLTPTGCAWKGWTFVKNYRSPGAYGWGATALSKETLEDPQYSIFLANRRYMYSQRAGEANIVRYWPRFAGTEAGRNSDSFLVKSQHHYYDPSNKQYVFLGTYKAYDCNLTEWGFEHR